MKRRDLLHPTAALALTVATTAHLAAQTAARIPEPEEGRWTVTVVALLQHSHESCAGIADRLTNFWRSLSGDEGQVRSSLDDYVLMRATQDLAGARQALDVARRFLPEAVLETGPETGAILDRLYEAEDALCHLVAQPAPPLSQFRARLSNAKAEISEIEAELGKELTLPVKKELFKELRPYLRAIEAAGGIAQKRMLDDLQVRQAPPKTPTEQELMEAWHQRYLEAALPAKMALRDYLEGRRESDAGAIQEACRNLLATVIPLLTTEAGLFRAPNQDVEEPLKNAFIAMRRLGGHCTSGRFDEVDADFQWLRQNLAKASEVLAAYSLQP